MADAVLSARDVWKSYDGRTDVLRGISLDVAKAEAVLIWGPNGSGKTTLLSILGGLDVPDRGSVSIAGREITGLREADLAKIRLHDVGFVFQVHNLIDDLTVEENIALPLRLAKKPADERVGELMETFGLIPLATRRPKAISVGESQRVSIARALANGPKVILADEPTAALDMEGYLSVLEAFNLARTSFGAAIVMASHDVDIRGMAASQYGLRDGVLSRVA
ncbi:MAG TPA: ABC transporter ATP-binding protein [Thermoplasmata archaeon]